MDSVRAAEIKRLIIKYFQNVNFLDNFKIKVQGIQFTQLGKVK